MRSAACLRVIRFRQSGQYLTLLEVDAKEVPHGTTLFILGLEKLCIQQLIKGQYGGLKPFAKKRIGNKLRADTFLPVVQ